MRVKYKSLQTCMAEPKISVRRDCGALVRKLSMVRYDCG